MISYFRKLNFVFFGTPEFAAVILEKLIEAGFVPAAVVCNPDRPAGRKKIVTPPPVKRLLIEEFDGLNIAIYQPEKLSEIKRLLSDIDCQLFIIAAYSKIIPKEILDIPQLGSVGVHPSLLPKYRGPSPIQTALLNGDEKTGVTLFLTDEKIDHGPILVQQELNYELNLPHQRTETADCATLTQKLAKLSGDLLVKTLPDIENKIRNAQPQDESLAVYTAKFKTEDGFVDFNDLKTALRGESKTAEFIERKIRALNPEPGVFTVIGKNGENKRIKLLSAALEGGRLKLAVIQPEGKKPLIDSVAIKRYINTDD